MMHGNPIFRCHVSFRQLYPMPASNVSRLVHARYGMCEVQAGRVTYKARCQVGSYMAR